MILKLKITKMIIDSFLPYCSLCSLLQNKNRVFDSENGQTAHIAQFAELNIAIYIYSLYN